ncbi:MAG: class I SAM-dependent rRNA methyltransferase [Myxococcota bacterium]
MDRGELRIRLRKPLERVLAEGHPWVYRDALERHDAAPGTPVTVLDRRGRFAGRGWADAGPIAVRVVTTRDEPLDAALLGRRVRAAAMLRTRVVPPDTSAYRLLHGEGDRLPGVVVDVYDRHAVLELDGLAPGAWRPTLREVLGPTLAERGVRTLLDRSDGSRHRTSDGQPEEGPTPAPVEVREHGMRLWVDLVQGQKTGLFLDHRESRRRVRELAAGQRVLNLYGYTGGFSAAAGLGGAARVTTVDQARPALELADATWRSNALDTTLHRTVAADVPAFLQERRRGRTPWDLIVCDPPSFAPNEASVPKAVAAYRRLHASCLGQLSPGGLYLAASCSSHVDRAAFDQTLREGARSARRVVQVLERWGAPADHPRLAAFPEGDYLKVTLCRVVD